MTTLINADTVVGGAVITADASGELALQAAGATKLTVGSSGVTLASALPATSGGTGATTYTTGDVIYASATNTLSKLGIGSSGQVLSVSGGVPAWATPSAGAMVLLSTVNASSGASTVDVESGISTTYEYYLIQYDNITLYNNGFSSRIGVRFKVGSSYSTSSYFQGGVSQNSSTSSTISVNNVSGGSGFYLGNGTLETDYASYKNKLSGQLWFYTTTTANTYKTYCHVSSAISGASSPANAVWSSGAGYLYDSSSLSSNIAGVRFYPIDFPSQAYFSTGTFRLYGIVKT